MRRSDLFFAGLLVPVDYLMLVLAGLAAYFLRTSGLVSQWRPVLFEIDLPLNEYFVIVLVTALFWLVVFAVAGLYKIRMARLVEQFFQLIIASSAGLMAIIIYIFIRGEFFNSRFIILAAWVLAILFVFLGRVLVRKIQQYLIVNYNYGIERVLVVGGDKLADSFINEVSSRPELGLRVVGQISPLDMSLIREVVGKEPIIDEILLGETSYPNGQVLELIDFCQEKRIDFRFVPSLFQATATNLDVETLGALPIIRLKRTALEGWGRIIKRALDIFISFLCIIIFSPIMAIITIAVKLNSSGPVFYKNERVGPKENFKVYKFRSMKLEHCIGKEYPFHQQALELHEKLINEKSVRQGPVGKVGGDPRRTKVGRFLEKWTLDELPQFFNVLKGEMSIVGPRPHMPEEVAGYQKHHMKVFNIKPGITGLAQISGRSDLDFEEEVKLDVFYIENWSLRLDLRIMLKTPFVVLFGKHKS